MVKCGMRVSLGVPRGRNVEIFNAEMFQEHEEVIVFTREDFNRTYTSMREQIDYINKKPILIEIGEDWKLLGYWPNIMKKIHLLDLQMNLIFEKEPLQSYLDAYLFNTIQNPLKTDSEKEVITSITASDLNFFY